MLNGKLRNILAALSLTAALAACQTNNIDIGTGSITLSGRTMDGFEIYLSRENPMAFAVREDGKVYNYSMCLAYSCSDDVGDIALSGCRKRARGMNCKILAFGPDVVWKGQVSYRPDPLTDQSPTDRPIFLFWHDRAVQVGDRPSVRGVARGVDKKTFELSFVKSKRFGSCKGTVDKGESKFTVECSKMGQASDRFELWKNGGGIGSAEDQNGRILELRIVPRSKYRDSFERIEN
jgi:hypothetical protein